MRAEWAKLLRTNGILQRVLQVMEENHPARFTINADNNGDLSPTRAAIELGETRGYSKYGDRLRIMAELPIGATNLPEPTYRDLTDEEKREYARTTDSTTTTHY